jgi:hypothetical protein
MSAPIEGVMKFTLVYSGKLSSSGNASKTKEVFAIREKLSPQLEVLWKTSAALKALKEQAWVRNPERIDLFGLSRRHVVAGLKHH